LTKRSNIKELKREIQKGKRSVFHPGWGETKKIAVEQAAATATATIKRMILGEPFFKGMILMAIY
jgi:hypothetical protein